MVRKKALKGIWYFYHVYYKIFIMRFASIISLCRPLQLFNGTDYSRGFQSFG